MTHRRRPLTQRRTRGAGFSLIELLVAMAIGLVVTLAITSVMIRSESSKRSSTSVNDINQTGAYAAYVLDRAIRSAGSGYSQRWGSAYGCLLGVSKKDPPSSGTRVQVLPVPSAIAASSAFYKLTASPALPLRLAPVVIGQDMANTAGEVRGDVLIVMAGAAGVGESPQSVNPVAVSASAAVLPNTLGFRTGDLVLLADPTLAGCLLEQVNFGSTAPTGAVFPTGAPNPGGSTDANLPFLNTDDYYTASISDPNLALSLTSFGSSGSTIAAQLGNGTTNRPQFTAYGVGANRTLVSYDLLDPLPGGAVPDAPVADGIVEMRAVYGIDNSVPLDGTVDAWVEASGTGATDGYAAATLMDGSATSQVKLRKINAVRIGVILRTAQPERSAASAGGRATGQETFQQSSTASLTLFSDLPTALQRTRTLSTDDRSYRFRTVEVTIPLRNVQIAPSVSKP